MIMLKNKRVSPFLNLKYASFKSDKYFTKSAQLTHACKINVYNFLNSHSSARTSEHTKTEEFIKQY